MATSLTAEEVRQRNVAAMGVELGDLFTVLSNELTWLYCRWDQYVKLFAGKKERLAILNASAPSFFWIIQQTLWHDTLLGISRLAGPERSAGKPNLSVRRLPPLVNDAETSARVDAQLVTVIKASAFAIDWRNRYIAHRDLDLSLGREVSPLASASKEAVDSALTSLVDLLNIVDLRFVGSETMYRFSPLVRDADELVYVLRDGLRREDLRKKKLDQGGEYDPQDWNDDLPPL